MAGHLPRKLLSCYFDQPTIDALREASKVLNTTVAALIREGVALVLDRHREQTAKEWENAFHDDDLD
jgi:hypothetical protein